MQMKNKLGLVCALLMSVSSLASAEETYDGGAQTMSEGTKNGRQMGVDVGLALPVGDASTFTSFGLGGLFRYQMGIAEKLDFTGRAGLLYYFGKNGAGGSGVIPLLPGLRYFFSPEFFALVEAGLYIGTRSGSGTNFGVSGGAGYELENGMTISGQLAFLDLGNAGSSTNIMAFLGIPIGD